MGKLNFLLLDDYVKPKIYFKSKTSDSNVSYSNNTKNQFEGLNNLTQLLNSQNGFIINAFQVDYFQKLPNLIADTLHQNRIFKKIYILGPTLSLSILNNSISSNYLKTYRNLEYIDINNDQLDLVELLISILSKGHIIYVLPETSISWQPDELLDLNLSSMPLCSVLLSQLSGTPILSTLPCKDTDKLFISSPSNPREIEGSLKEKVERQSNLIYDLLSSSKNDGI